MIEPMSLIVILISHTFIYVFDSMLDNFDADGLFQTEKFHTEVTCTLSFNAVVVPIVAGTCTNTPNPANCGVPGTTGFWANPGTASPNTARGSCPTPQNCCLTQAAPSTTPCASGAG